MTGEQAVVKCLQLWVRKHKILTRWPCFYCGRVGRDAPLRTVTVTNSDGEVFESGCIPCTQDNLIEASEMALAQMARDVFRATAQAQEGQRTNQER